jgi:hypothetical protein
MSFSQSAVRASGAKSSLARAPFYLTWLIAMIPVIGASPAHASDSPPTISGVSPTSIVANRFYRFWPAAKDPNGDRLKFSITNKPSWAQFDTRTGILYGTPGTRNVGTVQNIVITVSDGQLSASLAPFNLTVVSPINRTPVLSGTPPATATVGTSYGFKPSVANVTASTLTFTAQNRPAWLALNAQTGQLQGTPSTSNVGTWPNIVLSASDGKNVGSLPPFSIKVQAAGGGGSTITLSGTPDTTVTQNNAYSFQPSATDSTAGATITFSIQNKPSWANFNASTGALTGTPTQVTTYSNIVISATDGTANAALAPFSIQVEASDPTTPVVGANCGMVLGGKVTFCDTFDAPAGIGNRAGDLNGNVWGVSRAMGSGVNFGQQDYNLWNSTLIRKCDGTMPRVNAPHDVIICNGQLREASNDNNSGVFDAGDVTSLAMYPKQPFDYTGRTGTVSFDVSNDTAGSHAAWPEFWLSDLPVPDPFNHFDSWQSLPPNGFGIRLHAESPVGQWGVCPNGNNLDKVRWTAASAVVIRNYVLDDTDGFGQRSSMNVKPLDCVIAANGPGQMNHVEIRVSQNQIDVYATDAGVAPSPTTLKHIAVVTNANLSVTRGLIWLADVHYNADKGDSTRPSQREHTFAWDNVAFDGPFVYRDFSYDALDNTVPGPNGAVNLGKYSAANQTSTWNVAGLPANPQAAAVRVLFNFSSSMGPNPTALNVIVNGHAHTVPWPFHDNIQGWRTYAVTIPITDLVAGTNVVQLGATVEEVFSNVNLVLVDVPGGVPVLPGSTNTYPH